MSTKLYAMTVNTDFILQQLKDYVRKLERGDADSSGSTLRTAGIVPHERFELNALNAIAVMVDRGLGVSLVPDWARPWPEGLQLVRIPLPRAFEPRRIGIVWSRSTIRIRLVTAFLQEARTAMAAHQAMDR